MNIFYTLKEGISGFNRARLSALVSTSTITVALILLGGFSILYLNTNEIVQSFRDRVEMEAFLDKPLSDTTIVSIQKQLASLQGIHSTVFISKEQATKIFKEEFGEDIYSVLEFNPLPPSFKIYLQPNYRNADSAQTIYTSLKSISGIDDIIYRKTLLELLDKRSRLFIIISITIGIILTFTAIFLIFNTIRLTIYAKRNIITIMKLVGATRMFIRLPFLIEGMLQGILGGIFASGIIYLVTYYASQYLGDELAELVKAPFALYIGLTITGIFLGFIGSAFSVRKFISEKIVNQ